MPPRLAVRFAVVSVMLLFAVRVSNAQVTQPSPKFDVVSVRAVDYNGPGIPPGFASNPRRVGNRLTWTTNLFRMTAYAYDLPFWQIVGIKQEQRFFAIEATFNANATQDDTRLMLRALLADRFKMVTHIRTETRSGFAIVVAGGGSRLRGSGPDGNIPPMPDYLAGMPPEILEGSAMTSAEGLGVVAITGRGVQVSRLAKELSAELEAFVQDRTGLTGRYYFGFRFVRPRAVESDPAVATLFTAIEEELGLRLVPQKGEASLLVVESAESPSAN